MTTVSLVFDHRGRAKQGEPGAVEVRITVNRRAYYISTGVRVRKEQWKFGAVVNHEQAAELTEKANIMARKVLAYANECESKNLPVDIKQLREAISSNSQAETAKRTAFLDWCQDQHDLMGVGEGTMKHYGTLFVRLHEYGMTAWEDITAENILRFDAWLHRLKNVKGQPISDAAVWNYHKRLKAMLNRAIVVGKLNRNPYDRLRGQFKRGEKENVEYLTDEEMAAFMALKPVEGSMMAKARDLFVFQMFTGMSYADTQAFDIADYKEVDGQWMKVGERIKTGVAYVSVLLPPVIDVLKRNDWKVPAISNVDYNHELKGLGMAAGISTPLHSHLARHSFATWMLRNGAKIENVSKMLGHTNITQTQRYAKVLAQSVQSDFTMMAKKLESK